MSAPTPEPITAAGEFYPDTIDPMMAAIRQAIVDAPSSTEMEQLFPALGEFGEEEVVVIQDSDTEETIDGLIATAVARTNGLCLLLSAGAGKNPDTTAPGPRVAIELEAGLYVDTRRRADEARTPLVLMAGIAKFLHHQQLRVTGFPWYEEIIFNSYEPLPDPDFTAYLLRFTRETTL